MANKWFKELKSMPFAVNEEYDSFSAENCMFTPSPYLNWLPACKGGGFPKNSSILFFSEPKSGKTFLCLSIIAEMHKNDPEGVAVYVSSELRGQLQATNFPGIDKDRILIVDSNDPVEIFDELLDANLKPQFQDGMPLRMIVLDSVTGIQGIKRKHAETIEQHLIGDQALTIGNALANLVPWCKRNKILLIGTAQMRANIDANPYAEKTKMQASFAVRHSFEFFISVKRAGSAEDKKDIEGKTFEEEGKEDARGNGLVNAHRVYVKMEASSLGPAGRSGVFTLSYDSGVKNQHEEIFFLGKNTGVIKVEGQTYSFGKHSVRGKAAFALLIRDNPELAEAILKAVKELDRDR